MFEGIYKQPDFLQNHDAMVDIEQKRAKPKILIIFGLHNGNLLIKLWQTYLFKGNTIHISEYHSCKCPTDIV